MADRTIFRLRDIDDSITQIQALLDGKAFEDLQSNRVMRAAFERFLEIISEASRHIPDEMMAMAPEIPWRRVKDIGNHLRHAYNRVGRSDSLESLRQWRTEIAAGCYCKIH